MLKTILFILLIILLVPLYIYNKENWYIGFSRKHNKKIHNTYITNTSLKQVQSRLKINKSILHPNFLLFNPKYLSSVGDQKSCGACAFYVCSGMLADRVNINTLNNPSKINLSTQNLINCYTGDDDNLLNNCIGAESVRKVLVWIDDSNFLLNIINKRISNDFDNISNCILYDTGISVKADSIYSLCNYVGSRDILTLEEQAIINENILNMKSELMFHGPFYATIEIYENFLTLSGYDIYRKPSNDAISLGGHSVVVVGWCDKGIDVRQGFEEGYWICRNSWGTNWSNTGWVKGSKDRIDYGLDGYFLILMGSNSCGVESMCGAAQPNITLNPDNIQQAYFDNYSTYFIQRAKL